MPTDCIKHAFMKVALNRPGKFSRSKQSRSNVSLKYADPRRFFARRSAELGRSLASEIFLTNLQTAFFNDLLAADNL
jgi:hypothetical protein